MNRSQLIGPVWPPHRYRKEQGAFLLIFAASILLLLTLVAFAVDLGQTRFTKRDTQQAADLASLSAGYFMAGNATSPPAIQPRAACTAAMNSISTNVTAFGPTAAQVTATCGVFPISASETSCDETTSPVTTVPLEVGGYTATIRWPVPAEEIKDPLFSGNGLNDGTTRCQRMQVSLDRRFATTFARVIGVDEMRTGSDAVVLGGPTVENQGVAALLVLEREGCGALQVSGQGKVVVKSATDSVSGRQRPGLIQADSAGSAATFAGSDLSCKTTGGQPPQPPQSNSSGYVIYGSCTGPMAPEIVAEATADGQPGIIGVYAKRIGSVHAAACYASTGTTGLNVEPSGSDFTGRKPADDRFNPQERQEVQALHSSVWGATVTNALSGTGFDTDCRVNNNATRTISSTGEVIFDCRAATGQALRIDGTLNIPNATSVRIIGNLNVTNGGSFSTGASNFVVARPTVSGTSTVSVGGTLTLSKATSVSLGGCATTCNVVSVSGKLRVNTASDSCALGPGADGSATSWTKMGSVGGALSVSGSVFLCQTTVYLGNSTSTRIPANLQRSTGGLNCSSEKPCPLLSTIDSGNNASVSGGAGSSITWTAPNQNKTGPTISSPFEGLALWTEATGTSSLKGQGQVDTTGVFFLPNAKFEFGGTSLANNPSNAQFFARTLNFSGQGTLELSPDPRDSVRTPVPGSYGLIR